MGRMAREYAGGDSRGPGWRELAGTLGQLQAGRQAGSGMARSRARARLNWVSQGQPCGRCRVRRPAERVSRPARAKNRRRRVLMVTTCSPRPIRAVQRARLSAITCTVSQAPFGKLRTGGEAARGEMAQPHTVLEVSDGILDLGVAAMIGLHFQGLPIRPPHSPLLPRPESPWKYRASRFAGGIRWSRPVAAPSHGAAPPPRRS